MKKTHKKVIYTKKSSQGSGPIPTGAEGSVILFSEHPVTTKLLVDFSHYGKAIVPLSSVNILEDTDV